MEGAVALVYILILTGGAYAIANSAKKKGPETQKKLAWLCIILGFICIPIEIFTIAITFDSRHGGHFVFGGEIALWYMAWRIFKMTGSAAGRAFQYAAENRLDSEACPVYAAGLKEDPSLPIETLRVALQAFRQNNDQIMVTSAAERVLRLEPNNAQAQAFLVEALTKQDKLKAAEDAATRFAAQTPESAVWMNQALDNLRKRRAEARQALPERTLADLAGQSPPDSWTPIKFKRYAGQICQALSSLSPTSLPPAIAPEDFLLDDANNLRFSLNRNARSRAAFTPPEGELHSVSNPTAGLVYGAGRVLMFLVSGGQLAQMPVGWCKSRNQLYQLSPGMMTPEVSCPVCGKNHKPLDASDAPLRALVPQLTAAHEKAIRQAAHPTPSKRFKDLADFLAALQKA